MTAIPIYVSLQCDLAAGLRYVMYAMRLEEEEQEDIDEVEELVKQQEATRQRLKDERMPGQGTDRKSNEHKH